MTPRREVPLDAAAILRALADHEVDFILIGGLAVQAHGHVRTTQDVDVLPSPESANLSRLSSALEALDAGPAGKPDMPAPTDVSAKALAAAGTMSLDTRAGGLDVHLSPPGAARYDRLRERALELQIAGTTVAVAGRDDLIAMKRAAGRPLDRGDVIALTDGEADEPPS